MGRRALALLLGLPLLACGDDGGGGDSSSSGDASSGAPVATSTGATPTTSATDATEPSPGSTGDGSSGEPQGSTGEPSDTSTGEPVGPVGYFIAVGDGGRRARSQDGEVWESQVGSGLLDTDSDMAAPDALRALAVGDGYVVAVGGGGNFFTGNAMVMRSTDDGATWQEDLLKDKPDFAPHKLYGVAASGPVLVAAGMRGKRIRSEDGGLGWTDISFEDSNARLLAVAAQASTFVVVGWTEDSYEAPKTSAILTSSDLGVTWNPVDESFTRLDAIAAGNGVFVALGTSECLTSSDGLAWVDCGQLSNGYRGVSFADGEFVLSTIEGLATSVDGLAWTTPTLPEASVPAQLARGNGRYVGIRWTDRGWAEDLEGWSYATWAAEPLRTIVFVPTP